MVLVRLDSYIPKNATSSLPLTLHKPQLQMDRGHHQYWPPHLPDGRETAANHIATSDVAEVCADLENTEWLEPRLIYLFHYVSGELGGKKMEE